MLLLTSMTAPLSGIRVLEVANWLAAPAAGALLADLGADVIKVEPPGGDVFREFLLRSMGYAHEFATNYAFQLDNRGKRSVTVALDKPGGPELVRRLAAGSDVFLTNLIQGRRLRYGLSWEDVRAVNTRILYASFSGYGTRGPDENRPGFDYAAFWARSGLMGLLGEPPSPPPLCRGGQGDHTTALNILAAVLAALRLRDQTNEAQHVEVTLQGTGMWTLAGGDLQAALLRDARPARLGDGPAPRHDGRAARAQRGAHARDRRARRRARPRALGREARRAWPDLGAGRDGHRRDRRLAGARDGLVEDA